MLDARDVSLGGGSEQAGNLGIAGDRALVGHVHPDQKDTAAIRDLVVPVQLVFDPEENEGGAGDAKGEAGNVEEAMGRAFAPAPDGRGEMVP